MNKMAQGIILVLFLLLGGSVFMVLQTLNQKQTLERSNSDLQNQLNKAQDREKGLIVEKKKFEEQIQSADEAKAELDKQVTDLNDQLAGLNKKIDEITADRDDLKTRVDSITKERDELTTKLAAKVKELEAGLGEVKTKVVAMPDEATKGEGGKATDGSSTASLQIPPNAGDHYWAAVLKEKAELSLKVTKYKTDLDTKVIEIEQLKKDNSELTMEITSLKDQKDTIQRKIKEGEDLADSLSVELARARGNNKFADGKLDDLRKDNDNLRTEVKRLNETKLALEKSIAKLADDKRLVEKRLADTEGLIQGRIDEIYSIKDSLDQSFQQAKSKYETKEVELSPIVVNAPGAAVSLKEDMDIGFNGKIVSINEDNNFVIVDLGENSGVQLGEVLSVYRGAQNIGKLEVIQVRKEIAAADIKQKTAKLVVGDIVK